MTAEDDRMFKSITDEAIGAEASSLLCKQLTRCQMWAMERRAAGETATLADLIRQTISEPNERRHVLIAYSAALWKLMGEADG